MRSPWAFRHSATRHEFCGHVLDLPERVKKAVSAQVVLIPWVLATAWPFKRSGLKCSPRPYARAFDHSSMPSPSGALERFLVTTGTKVWTCISSMAISPSKLPISRPVAWASRSRRDRAAILIDSYAQNDLEVGAMRPASNHSGLSLRIAQSAEV